MHLGVCTTVARLLSIMFVVANLFSGRLMYSITRNTYTSAIVLCNCSTIAFACGFFTVVGFAVIPRVLIMS